MGQEETVQGAVDPRTWLTGACRHMEALHPGLEGWQIDDEPDGLVLRVRLPGHALRVHVRPLDEDPAWIRTRSFSLTLNHEGDGKDVPPEARDFEVGLRQLLRMTDPGGLELDIERPGEADGGEAADEDSGPKRVKRVAPRKALGDGSGMDRLHYAAFIGWRSHMSHDDYPHHSALGDPTDREEIEDGWRDTARRMRDGTAPGKLGLYVHVPFCRSRCTFCMFTQTPGQSREVISKYVDELCKDMRLFGGIVDGKPLDSIWLGGGTPSILTAGELARVLDTMHDSFDVPDGTQIVFEGDSRTLDEEKIATLASGGRNIRLTIGVQSLDPEVQKEVRRFEKPEKVVEVIGAARRHDIRHVNVDLMAGLPRQSLESFQKDILFFLEHRPDSVHVNPFIPLPWTRYSNEGGTFSREHLELTDRMSRWAIDRPEMHLLDHQLQLTEADARVAGNNQLEDIDRRAGSVLGLGLYPLGHSFANHYYLLAAGEIAEPLEKRRSGKARMAIANMDEWPDSVEAYCRGERTYIAMRVDEAEERHRYLIHSLRFGISISGFREIFGVEPREVAPEGWELLEYFGVLRVDGDRVETSFPSRTEWLIYRTLLYSESTLELIKKKWDVEYDPSIDYEARLRAMYGEIS